MVHHLAIVALFASFYLSGGTSADRSSIDDNLTQASYSFWSAVYRSMPTSEPLGIAARPLAFPEYSNCLMPTTTDERRMVESVKTQIAGSAEWKRQFDLPGGYIIVPTPDFSRAVDCINSPKQGKVASDCGFYAKLRYVRSLSIPVFNDDQTRAVVAIARVCGGLCGDGGVFEYRKTSQGWEQVKDGFAKCHWVA